jgi:hypothetical protein
VRWSSLLLFIGCVILLLSGNELLLLPVFGLSVFPAGTLVAWLGFVSLAILCFPFPPIFKLHLISACFSVFNALIWGIVSYVFAGNWQFEFSNESTGFIGSPEAFTWFKFYSLITFLFPIFTTLVFKLIKLFKKIDR